MKLTIQVRRDSGLAANFGDAKAKTAVRRVVQREGAAHHAEVYADTPVRLGNMRALLTLRYSEGGQAYALGWQREDFTAAGLPWYIPYVLDGTRTQRPNPYFYDIGTRRREPFKQAVGAELKAAYARRSA